MKLRYIIAAGILTLLIGGSIWLYDSADNQMATGAGGLPLIKASADPVKIPPEEPGGEVMPHADSTVFAAISSEDDPSMEGVKAPQEGEAAAVPSTEFAGLRTGFAVPAEPEAKTESLFGEQQAAQNTSEAEPAKSNKYVSGLAPDAVPAEKSNKYISGLAPEAIAEPVVAPATQTEETVAHAEKPVAVPEVKKPEKAAKVEAPKPQPEIETASAPIEAPAVSTEGPADAAQAMEAHEKSVIRPTAKPVPPVTAKAKQVEAVERVVDAEKPTPDAKPKKTAQAPAPVREVEVASVAPLSSIQPRAGGMKPIVEEPESVRPATGGNYQIQLASAPSKAEAEHSWSQLQSMYPDALRGLKPVYKSADVAGKGTYIRLRAAGNLSRAEANARCDAIRAAGAGGGCLVLGE